MLGGRPARLAVLAAYAGYTSWLYRLMWLAIFYILAE